MKYEEVEEFLFSQLPMYQRLGGKAMKPGLENIGLFCDLLDNPQRKFKTIHIAGTNGKGSTAHFIASILQEAGYKVGLHTSPHLKDFRERVKINGDLIPKSSVVAFVQKHTESTKTIEPSFFEWALALSFDYFAKSNVDIAVIETGLGGRLDATNIVVPEVSVITNIGLDHCNFLGNDLASIAREKAGIIKKDVPVVLGEVLPETEPVFKEIADSLNAPIIISKDEHKINSYQDKNIATTKITVDTLQKAGWDIKPSCVEAGIKKMVANTGLRGRWDVIGESPKVICDVGHNGDGLKLIKEQLQKENYNQLHIVLGVSEDKSLEPILTNLPKEAMYYFCKAKSPRSMDEVVLQSQASLYGRQGEVYKSTKEAYSTAIKNAIPEDLVFVGGSFFVVGEIL